ncbi:MAG: aminodeoxychorismate/anthranilate synthase component II [Planctomycetota bacterium]
MILLIDNYDSFTWNLVQRLGEIDPSLEPGRDLHVARADKITPADADKLDSGNGPTHLLISPGPCTPDQSGNSRDLIRHFAGRIPVLGVCLGHQCMADIDGMTVHRAKTIMHGKTSPVRHDGKGVFAGLPNPFEATRYHSLTVDPATIPPLRPGVDGWEVSATAIDPDGRNEVVMGLRRVWGEPTTPGGAPKAPLEGVQFHPESFLTEAGPKLLKNFLEMGVKALPATA